MCALGLSLLAAGSPEPTKARGDPNPSAKSGREVGRLVRVPLPIKGLVDDNVKRAITRIVSELPQAKDLAPDDPRPVLILEFWPQPNTRGEGSEFERSLSLARFLTSDRLSHIRTVAYLPRSIAGHAVLPVLACTQIIMHPEAEFGHADVDEQTIDATVRRGYAEVANQRRTVPEAVALGLVDKRLQVSVVDQNRYVLADELAELKAKGEVTEVETIIPEGETGNFTGNDMRLKYGFASHLVADRRELAQVLDLPPRAIEIDASYGRAWKAIRVDVKGPLNTRTTSQAENAITDRLRREDVNFILVYLDTPGGSPSDSVTLAQYLISLDPSRIRTVAYVPEQALSDAALIAMACDHVVMGDAAKLGGPGTYQPRADEIATLREEIIPQLAREKARSWSLWAALIDPDLEVTHYRQNSGLNGYFSPVELAEQMDPAAWKKVETITQPGTPLQLTGQQAQQFGVARYVVADLEELKLAYRLEGELTTVKPNWALQLIDALAQPHLAWMLVFIGGFCFMSELMSPGIGIPGFVACVCFLFFFWSQFLNGTADWLEILLFVAGLSFLALEVFVLPGFGIFGLGGGAMVIAAVVLATQTFVVPRNAYQFSQIPQSFLPLAAMVAGGAAALVLMRHFLPRTPVVNQMFLQPPEGAQLEELSRRESMVALGHLAGKQGRTTTQLKPAGKARFGDDLVDVISQGEVIESGADIRVLEVLGNRVLVERVEPS